MVTSNATPNSWDVIIVPFPYSERLAEKRRPALVVSGDKLHQDGFVWIVMITGAGKPPRNGDLIIGDLASTGLPGASMVRTSKLATVEPDRILRRTGNLASGERANISKAIQDFLAAG